MNISRYIKKIGRGKEGARALSREDSSNLLGLILDGLVSDLEVGAFCLAMRIKGETTEEMCGFLDATQKRLNTIRNMPTEKSQPVVVIPTYNGARKLPGLSPLLALLVAKHGFPVLMHGTATEDQRVFTADVLSALGIHANDASVFLKAGQVTYVPTESLHRGLQRLLDVRRIVGLRNPSHSLVKLLLPCEGKQVLVTSYTHPEYAASMESALCCMGSTALLLRGTEGESVADPRRLPKMCGIVNGRVESVWEHQTGALHQLPDLPLGCDAASTARYIQAVLAGDIHTPLPIAVQVERICDLAARMA